MSPIPKTSRTADSVPSSATKSFETALAELEGIVNSMEAGQMPLQASLDAYQQGVALLRQCQETLSAAEQQIGILDANGLQPFDPEADAKQHD